MQIFKLTRLRHFVREIKAQRKFRLYHNINKNLGCISDKLTL